MRVAQGLSLEGAPGSHPYLRPTQDPAQARNHRLDLVKGEVSRHDAAANADELPLIRDSCRVLSC